MTEGDSQTAWHARTADEVCSALGVDPAKGLGQAEARARLAATGPNVFGPPRSDKWWEETLESLTEPLILLLFAVGAVYAFLGEIEDAITILAVIVAVALIESLSEVRSKRAIQSLRALSAPVSTVTRERNIAQVPAADLVPGDVVLLQPGDRVPADVRLVETAALRLDESTLTGESGPIYKDAASVLDIDTDLADRRNLAHAGTIVTTGKGRGVVVATGPASQLGRIAALTASARPPRTPLQDQMSQLSRWLLWVALSFSVMIPVLGIVIARQPWREMVLTGLTLAFATIPEELPILITIVLALGALELARQRAIVKRLRAAETLGEVDVIATDKTGTLTENRMRLRELVIDGATVPFEQIGGSRDGLRLIWLAALATDARLAGDGRHGAIIGDPTDVALAEAASAVVPDEQQRRSEISVIIEYPFDETRKRMSIIYEQAGERWLVSKGAPEAIAAIAAIDYGSYDSVARAVEQLAGSGLRVLAVGRRRLQVDEAIPSDASSVEQDLEVLGLIGFEDPVRAEVPAAVESLRNAGIRVVIVTGDHPRTAQSVARRAGVPVDRIVRGAELDGMNDADLAALVGEVSVFARTTPEHKLRLVQALAAGGARVAVTGDGVNDGPALRAASIGVAMGMRGADVAREAADLVLADDNFTTIAAAVRGGRKLLANFRKAVRFYLAAKVALIAASVVPVLMSLPLPFSPVQIIVLELFMDLGASTTFVVEPGDPDSMNRPPRPANAPFMDRWMKSGVLAGGFVLALTVVVPFLWTWVRTHSAIEAQTAAFIAWLVGHVVIAGFMRSDRLIGRAAGPLVNRVYLVWAAAACGFAVLSATVPFLRARLHLAQPDAMTATVAVAAAILIPSGSWLVARIVARSIRSPIIPWRRT